MANGIEKRRFKRMKADLTLNVSSLFNQDNMEIKNLDSPIKVINISEGGIAFESKSMLPINFYFNAALNLVPCGFACTTPTPLAPVFPFPAQALFLRPHSSVI